MKNIILIGDVLEKLKEIPDQHVNTVVTSPPYWGLRDYGTAKWEDGDPECDHMKPNSISSSTLEGGKDTQINSTFYKDTCGKCGAIRKDNQIGLESTPEEYVEKIVSVFREIRRVLRDDGTLWLNLGDSYIGGGRGGKNQCGVGSFEEGRYERGQKIGLPTGRIDGLKPKDLCGIPWIVAFALRADGWYLRQDIIEEVELYCPCGCGYILEERIWRWSQDRDMIWKKPNPMPESIKDRCTKAHEYIFLLSKNRKYYYDAEAIREEAVYGFTPKPGMYKRIGLIPQKTHLGSCPDGKGGIRNKRSVWTVSTKPFPGAHFATFPPDLIEPCILAGCPRGGIVLDPFFGSGTVGIVSLKNARHYIGIELNPEYAEMARNRIKYGTVDEEKIVYEKSHYELFEDLRIDNGGKA